MVARPQRSVAWIWMPMYSAIMVVRPPPRMAGVM